MNDLKELDYWLRLAQMDLNAISGKDLLDAAEELGLRLVDRFGTFKAKNRSVLSGEFPEAISALRSALDDLRAGEPVKSTYTVKEERTGLFGDGVEVSTSTSASVPEAAVAAFLKVLKESDPRPDQVKECDCGKIFLQIGKREKRFCSSSCRNKAHRTKED